MDAILGMENHRKSCPFFKGEARIKQFEYLYNSDESRSLVDKKIEETSWTDAYTICVTSHALIRLQKKNQNGDLDRTPQEAFDWLAKAFECIELIISNNVINETDPKKHEWKHAFLLYNLQKALSSLLENEACIVQIATINKIEKDSYRSNLEGMRKDLQEFIEKKLHYYVSMCSTIRDVEDYAMQLGYLVFSLMEYEPRFKNDVLAEHAAKLCVDVLFGGGQFPRAQTVYRQGEDNISASPLEVLQILSTLGIVKNRFNGFQGAYSQVLDWLLATQHLLINDPVWYVEPWRGVDDCEAWLNVLVLKYLVAHRELIRYVCQERVKIEFGAVKDSSEFSWNEVLLDDESKEDLKQHFRIGLDNVMDEGTRLSKSAILLFGPPGTSKTSIAKTIATELKLAFILIAPHQFAEEGLEGLVRSTRRVFDRIRTLSHCVVLLDEIDELVTSRTNGNEKISRLVTTSVLPWLQKLKEQAQIILIATTNNIENFDAAVKRPGRFDFIVPVGPPSEAQRLAIIKSYIKNAPDEVLKAIAEGINQVNYSPKKRKRGSIKWQPTIGEIKFICEYLMASNTLDSNDMKCVAADAASYSERFAQHPLITYEDYMKFESDRKNYRYPPSRGK